MKIHLVADFNAEVLKRFLAAEVASNKSYQQSEVACSPVAQSLPYLIRLSQEASVEDYVFIFPQPEKIFTEFQKAKNLEKYDEALLFEELQKFIDLTKNIAAKAKMVMCHAFINFFNEPGYGVLDWRPHLGIRNLLAKINLYFSEQMASVHNFYLFEANELNFADVTKFNAKTWYVTKSPFTNQSCKGLAKRILQSIDAIGGRSRKIVILDLDNTLWGGVVGEGGWQGLRLGGHDHIGESFRDFQKALKQLTLKGVQLGIVSKNDESVALEAIDNHPDMILKRENFAGWKINWQDKAGNIVALMEELNLGLSSAVFIDDNPVERERIKMSLPEVLVPDWPEDPTQYIQSLFNLNCFDVASLTEEDRSRTNMYVADRSRRESKANVGDVEGWLESLGTKLSVEKISNENLQRVAQLYNKTNQLNLSTRRLAPNEILKWAEDKNCEVMAVSVSDRFGDIGLTGVLGLQHVNGIVNIVDYILSCRVMGRSVEESMFYLSAKWAKEKGASKVIAKYLPTQRNRPTLDVLKKCGLKEVATNEYILDSLESYSRPASVDLNIAPGLLMDN